MKILNESEVNELKQKVNLLLLTANEIEKKSLYNKLTPLDGYDSIMHSFSGNNTYSLGVLGKYPIIHVHVSQGGITPDSTPFKVLDAINCWDIKAVIMVGVAFGIDETKQTIGDVLVSESIVQYESAKIKNGELIPRALIPRSGLILFDRFKNHLDWEYKLSTGNQAKVYTGQILSGEKLIDDRQFKAQLLEYFPNAIGGEMEGASLYSATFKERINEWIVVKGICDWAENKDTNKEKNQIEAAEAAVSLCEHVLSNEQCFESLGIHSINQKKKSMNQFVESFHCELFYEDAITAYLGGRSVALKDVYISSRCQFNLSQVARINFFYSTSTEHLITLFIQNKLNEILMDLKAQYSMEKYGDERDVETQLLIKDLNNLNAHKRIDINIMIISGDAGFGKSSLIARLAYDNFNNVTDIFDNKKVHFVKFKNMVFDVSLDFNDAFIRRILKHLNIQEKELINAVLVLDGFDELCMIEGISDEGQIQKILDDLTNISDVYKCKLIITTRPNYIGTIRNDKIITVNLEPFNYNDIKRWLKLYFDVHKNTDSQIINRFNLIYQNNLNVIQIPLILYIALYITIFNEDVQNYRFKTSYHLYNYIFGENSLIFSREYDISKAHPSKSHKEELRKLAMYIAIEIYNSNKLFLPGDEFGRILKRLKDDMLINDSSLKWLKSNFGISYYFNISSSTIEFMHKSILDFFVVEHMYEIIMNSLSLYDLNSMNSSSSEIIRKNLNSILSIKILPKEMIELFKYKFEVVDFYNHDIKNCILFEKLFVELSLTDFKAYYEIESHDTTINQILNLFTNMWMIFDKIFKPYYLQKTNRVKLFDTWDASVQGINLLKMFGMRELYEISDYDLKNFNIRKDAIEKLKFRNCFMDRAYFINNYFNDVIVQSCDIYATQFIRVRAYDTTFRKSIFENSIFSESIFTAVHFEDCHLINTSINKSTFHQCYFENIDLRGQTISENQYVGCIFKNVSIDYSQAKEFINNHLIATNEADESITVYFDGTENIVDYNSILELKKACCVINFTESYIPTTVEDFRQISLKYEIERTSILNDIVDVISFLILGKSDEEISQMLYIDKNEIRRIYNRLKDNIEGIEANCTESI